MLMFWPKQSFLFSDDEIDKGEVREFVKILWQRKELPSLGSRIHKKQAEAESRVSYPLPVSPVRTKMIFLDNKEKMLTGGGGQCPKEAGPCNPLS